MEIKLNGKNGGVALVSKKDFNLISQYSWSKSDDGYAYGTVNGKKVSMHAFIMKTEDDKIIDHINHIRHDNQCENLRYLTVQQNAENRSINRNKKSSQYRGVFYVKEWKKYHAHIKLDGKYNNLGSHDTEITAAEAVDMFLVHNHKDHVTLNFAEKKDEYLKRKYIPFVPNKNKKTKYYGVSKKRSKYFSRITHDKKVIRLCTSHDPTVCARAYDNYIVENKIPSKKLNFADEHPEYNLNCVIKTECKIIDNKTVRLIINNAPNITVLIDKEDYDKIKYYPWCLDKGKYIAGTVNNKTVRLARFLMNTIDPGIFIDHIDSNPFNNTKQNLRISNVKLNGQNKKKRKNASSDYYGVSLNNNSWRSQIRFNEIQKYIGYDSIEEHAARRRDLYILNNLPGTHYKLNFEWNPVDISNWSEKLSIGTKQERNIHHSKSLMISLLEDNFEIATKLNSMISFSKI